MDGSIMRELWIQTCTHYFNRLKEHMLGRQNQRQRVTDLFLKVENLVIHF